MQPDSIRPAARIPNFAVSDDIVHFQSKALRSRAKPAPETPRFPFISLSPKSVTIPELRCSFRVAARLLCLFCRKPGGFRLIFGQIALGPPNQRRAGAILPPQIWIGG